MDKLRLRFLTKKVLRSDILTDDEYAKLTREYVELTRDMLLEYPENIDETFAANRIIDSAILNSIPEVRGSWVEFGKQYAVDNYRVMENSNILELRPIQNGIEHLKGANDFFIKLSTSDMIVPVPTISELKSLIRDCNVKPNARNTLSYYVYCFECGLCVNAEYLLDALVATGATELSTSLNDGKFKEPLFFQSDTVKMAVLPIYAPGRTYERGKITLS